MRINIYPERLNIVTFANSLYQDLVEHNVEPDLGQTF